MINIQNIIPFMKKGWVAMGRFDGWWWFDKKPYCNEECGIWEANAESDWHGFCELNAFDITPVDDWTKSLIKIDNTALEKFEEEYQNNIQRTIQELKQDE